MRPYSIFFVLATVALAQSSLPQVNVAKWAQGSPISDSFYRDGALVKVIRNGGIEVRASAFDTGSKMRVQILVVNNSSARVDVVPDQFTLEITQPRQQALKYQDPGQMAKSIKRRAGWSGLAAGLGEASTKTVTSESQTNGNVSVHDQDGNVSNGTYSGSATTTTTVPDQEARQRSRERVAEIHNRSRNSIAELESVALRANTLEPGTQVEGAVFFSREKKHDEVLLRIPLAALTFEFTFHWKQK